MASHPAGLLGFVSRQNPAATHPATYPFREDRAIAQQLKFDQRTAVAPQHTSHLLKQPMHSAQNQPTYLEHDKLFRQRFVDGCKNAHTQRAFDDSTIGSDLEHTRSDIQADDSVHQGRQHGLTRKESNEVSEDEADEQEQQPGIDNYGQDDYGLQEYRQLPTKHESQSAGQHQNNGSARTQATSQRDSQGNSRSIQASKQSHQGGQTAASQQRPSHNRNLEIRQPTSSGKRGRSEEIGNHTQQPAHRQQPLEHDKLSERNRGGYPGLVPRNELQGNLDDSEGEDPESDSADESPSGQRRHKENHETQHNQDEVQCQQQEGSEEIEKAGLNMDVELDHGDDELQKMNYTQLKSESWEEHPHTPQPSVLQAPQQVSSDEKNVLKINLPEKILHYVQKDKSEQIDFFASLPSRDWEEAGDCLIGEFGLLLGRFKEARKTKRAIVAKFEEEIERRQHEVQGKSEELDKKLKAMRASGDAVLRGRLSLT